MKLRFKRWVAMLLLAAIGFAQASVSVASCPMERGTMAAVIALEPAEPCDDCDISMTHFGPQYANRCVAHCTADLQLAAAPVALVRGAADVPVLLLQRSERSPARRTGLEAPPLGAPPPRILLHSFLI